MNNQKDLLMEVDRVHTRGFIPMAAAVMLTAILWSLGFVDLLDERISDHALSIFPAVEEAPILVLEPSAGEEPINHAKLLDRLTDAGAALVVYTHYPAETRDFYEKAAALGNVVFARPGFITKERTILAAIPRAAQALPLPVAAALAPLGSGAIARHQQTGVLLDGQTLPTLERWAAEAMGIAVTPDARFRVNFTARGLPRVSPHHILKPQLPQHLIQNRVVLIGAYPHPALTARDSIRTAGGHNLSTVAYHGYALRGLLMDDTIDELPLGSRVGLVLLLLLLCSACTWFLYIRPVLRILIAMHLLTLALALLSPALLGVHTPAAEILTALSCFTFFTVLERYKRLLDDVRLFRLDFHDMLHVHLGTSGPAPNHRDHVDHRIFTGLRGDARRLEQALRGGEGRATEANVERVA